MRVLLVFLLSVVTCQAVHNVKNTALSELFSASASVFEYGIGPSTLVAARAGVQRYLGITRSEIDLQTVRNNTPEHFRFVLASAGQQPGYVPAYELNFVTLDPNPFDVYVVQDEPVRWYICRIFQISGNVLVLEKHIDALQGLAEILPIQLNLPYVFARRLNNVSNTIFETCFVE